MPLAYVLSVPTGRPATDRMPMVIMMHGRGGDGWGLAGLAHRLDGQGGYRFIFPNAPRAFEAAPGMTHGYTWFDDWPPQLATLAYSRAWLLAFVNDVAQRYPTSDRKIVISGFSQGALMAFDVGYRTSVPIAGVVSISGGIAENDVPDLASRRSLPVLIVHGTADNIVPVDRSRRTRVILARHGIQPQYHEHPGGHYLTAESLPLVAGFFAWRLR